MHSQSSEYLEILVTEPRRRDEMLNEAEAALRQVAVTQRTRGILVTRHDPARYTLELSDKVPFGQTHEHSPSRS